MSIRKKLKIDYWDVSPRSIKMTRNSWGPPVQLTIHGTFPESPEFESSDPDVVWSTPPATSIRDTRQAVQ